MSIGERNYRQEKKNYRYLSGPNEIASVFVIFTKVV